MAAVRRDDQLYETDVGCLPPYERPVIHFHKLFDVSFEVRKALVHLPVTQFVLPGTHTVELLLLSSSEGGHNIRAIRCLWHSSDLGKPGQPPATKP